jgi:CRP-like cAMP-binding protein
MHFLLAGRAEIFSIKLQTTLKVLLSGSFFGSEAVMNTTRPVSVRAVTACELMTWPKKEMRRILKDHPSITIELKKISKERNELLRQKYDVISSQQEDKRKNNLAVANNGHNGMNIAESVLALSNGLTRKRSMSNKLEEIISKEEEKDDVYPPVPPHVDSDVDIHEIKERLTTVEVQLGKILAAIEMMNETK